MTTACGRAERGVALLALLLVAACAPLPVRIDADAERLALQELREARLGQQPEWRLQGRIAVSAGGEGGNGRIEWLQRGEAIDIRLGAPVTRRSWRLSGDARHFVLEGLEGGARHGSEPEALLHEATGWVIPLRAMSDWARGARSDGPSRLSFSPDGLPALLEQDGWQVEYRDWWPQPDPALPRSIFAERGDARVRLHIDRWELLSPAAGADDL